MTTNPTLPPHVTAVLRPSTGPALSAELTAGLHRLAERLNVAKDPAVREKKRLARQSFDLDAVWAALPTPQAPAPTVAGAAGQRLQGGQRITWPAPLLVEFAREALGAQRISSGYLDALRVVLGNQAHAERRGHTLEQNLRVDFASVQVMRTINAQMHAARITSAVPVTLGSGRTQSVQCFIPARKPRVQSLNAVMRREETHAERMWQQEPPKAAIPACVSKEDVPY